MYRIVTTTHRTYPCHPRHIYSIAVHQFIGDLRPFWPSCLGRLVYMLPKLIIYHHLNFQPFAFELIWWRLFQKGVVRTKFDFYVFIMTMNVELTKCSLHHNHRNPWLSCFHFRSNPLTRQFWHEPQGLV